MRSPKFSEEEARAAIAASLTWSDALRRLGLRPAGGNHRSLKQWAARWDISTAHFDPNAVRRRTLGQAPTPLAEMLVEHSPYARQTVKKRLLSEGVKHPVCELCGQGELWRGRRMAMILDHINGVADDHRLENLQIVCPNCAATLDTHCGRHNRRTPFVLACPTCRAAFEPRNPRQRYCSQACAYKGRHAVPQLAQRKVPRPPYAQLVREVHALGWCGVGRRYGVSDNAIRKWVRQYERERAMAEAEAAADAERAEADAPASADAAADGVGSGAAEGVVHQADHAPPSCADAPRAEAA